MTFTFWIDSKALTDVTALGMIVAGLGLSAWVWFQLHLTRGK
jgi:hypothetical protein